MAIGDWIIPRLVAGWMRTAWKTALHVHVIGGESIRQLEAEGRPYVYAFWHNRIFMAPFATPTPAHRVVPVVSSSKDGDYISATVARLGHIHAVRGSSTRGGKEALKLAIRQLQQGRVMAVTPDGPLGPVYRAKEGAVLMARITGCPIVPFAYNCDRKLVFRSWDRFMVPLPCARYVFVFGETMEVTRDDEGTARTQALEAELNRITRIADEWEF